jgi:hypothetical protein
VAGGIDQNRKRRKDADDIGGILGSWLKQFIRKRINSRNMRAMLPREAHC